MTESQPAAIVFDGVSKSFGSKQVLQEVSFSVRQGETVCLLGRSGTGKSVTLKLLIGLLRPDIGKVLIGQDNISSLEGDDLSRLRRKMGFLFQSAALFDSATLEENLALPLRRLTDKSKLEIEHAVLRALAEVGLAADRYKMPEELSGGNEEARWAGACSRPRAGDSARR